MPVIEEKAEVVHQSNPKHLVNRSKEYFVPSFGTVKVNEVDRNPDPSHMS